MQEPIPSLRILRPDLNLPPEAEQLVVRATAKRPEDRHRSAAAFLEELGNCFGDIIYGRDMDRFLKVRRKRTVLRGSGASAAEPMRRMTPKQIEIESELGDGCRFVVRVPGEALGVRLGTPASGTRPSLLPPPDRRRTA